MSISNVRVPVCSRETFVSVTRHLLTSRGQHKEEEEALLPFSHFPLTKWLPPVQPVRLQSRNGRFVEFFLGRKILASFLAFAKSDQIGFLQQKGL